MSDDYKSGFKDGFAAGLEEGKKLGIKLPDYPNYLGSPGTCHVCGRLSQGVTGYVCSNANCPTRVTAYTTGATGAIGSNRRPDYPIGANGPTMNDSYELGN